MQVFFFFARLAQHCASNISHFSLSVCEQLLKMSLPHLSSCEGSSRSLATASTGTRKTPSRFPPTAKPSMHRSVLLSLPFVTFSRLLFKRCSFFFCLVTGDRLTERENTFLSFSVFIFLSVCLTVSAFFYFALTSHLTRQNTQNKKHHTFNKRSTYRNERRSALLFCAAAGLSCLPL